MTKTQPAINESMKNFIFHVHSRDELAALDITHLPKKISDIEMLINELRSKGLETKTLETECCYLRRELETRPARKESFYEKE
jgi:hypothetical protein